MWCFATTFSSYLKPGVHTCKPQKGLAAAPEGERHPKQVAWGPRLVQQLAIIGILITLQWQPCEAPITVCLAGVGGGGVDFKAESELAWERAARDSPAPNLYTLKPQAPSVPSSWERKSRLKPGTSFWLFFFSLSVMFFFFFEHCTYLMSQVLGTKTTDTNTLRYSLKDCAVR